MESPDDHKISPPSDEKTRLERLYDIGRKVYADSSLLMVKISNEANDSWTCF